MTSSQSSSQMDEPNPHSLRRSDRKRTKKIFKDDFMLPNPFKGKFKKHKGLRLPENLNSQIRKIEYLTERTLATLNYGKQEFSVEMLNEMKEAVNQQQTKLSEFLSIKLTGEKNATETKIYLNVSKITKSGKQKENTPKIQQNTIAGESYHFQDFQKQVMGIVTAQELYHTFGGNLLHQEDNISAFHDESDFLLAEAPRFRKESSKLLSDNYENHELVYNMEHILPDWHVEEVGLHSEADFSD